MLSSARAKGDLGWLIAIALAVTSGLLAVTSFAFGSTPKVTLADTLGQKLVEVPSAEAEEWYSYPLKGQFKGNTADLTSTFSLTTKALKDYNLTWKDIRFVVRTCRSYSTTGADDTKLPEIVIYCTNRTVPRAEAIAYHEQEQARASAQGSPALIG